MPLKDLSDLTPDERESADFISEMCGFSPEILGKTMVMRGETGTVHYGLGRCAEHFAHMEPSAISELVLLKLQQQEAKGR